jgi:rhamnogalacturonan endolyase
LDLFVRDDAGQDLGSISGGWSLLITTFSGDYNLDNVVDSADYTVWRDTLGSTDDLRADGSGNGVVDQADYGVWRLYFGMTLTEVSAGSGALASTASEPVQKVADADAAVPKTQLVEPAIFLSLPLSDAVLVHAAPQRDAVRIRIDTNARQREGELLLVWSSLNHSDDAADTHEWKAADRENDVPSDSILALDLVFDILGAGGRQSAWRSWRPPAM